MSTIVTTRIKVLYICHPFASDRQGNAERVRKICGWFAHVVFGPECSRPEVRCLGAVLGRETT